MKNEKKQQQHQQQQRVVARAVWMDSLYSKRKARELELKAYATHWI